MTRISCIIPAYNSEPYLARAVDSLLSTGWPDLEIIVVDDGSTDGTRKLAESLAAGRPGRVICLSHAGGRNRGVSASRNVGIERSTGALLCFLDADDFVYPHRFDAAARILEERPDVDGVYEISEIVFADAESAERWWDTSRTFGFDTPIPPQDVLFALLRGRSWPTSAILCRRALIERTGLFDARLRIAEDCHLWFRMACLGTLVGGGDLTRPVSVYWRHVDSSYQPFEAQRVHMVRAMTLFYNWMRDRDPSDSRLPRVCQCVSEYILRSIESARARENRWLAWTLAVGSASRFPRVLSQRRFYGHMWRMAAGQ